MEYDGILTVATSYHHFFSPSLSDGWQGQIKTYMSGSERSPRKKGSHIRDHDNQSEGICAGFELSLLTGGNIMRRQRGILTIRALHRLGS